MRRLTFQLTMPRPMMVRVPDLVLMHPQNVFITDIVLSYQPTARKKLKISIVDILSKIISKMIIV